MKIESNDKMLLLSFFLNIIKICFFEMSHVILLLTNSVIVLGGCNGFPLTIFKVFEAL